MFAAAPLVSCVFFLSSLGNSKFNSGTHVRRNPTLAGNIQRALTYRNLLFESMCPSSCATRRNHACLSFFCSDNHSFRRCD